VALYTAMRTAKITKAERARRLNCHLPQVDRLLDLRHASRLDQLEAAFRALGKQLPVQVSKRPEMAMWGTSSDFWAGSGTLPLRFAP
jgi:hypothetical protein